MLGPWECLRKSRETPIRFVKSSRQSISMSAPFRAAPTDRDRRTDMDSPHTFSTLLLNK